MSLTFEQAIERCRGRLGALKADEYEDWLFPRQTRSGGCPHS